ncbi:MAG: hypothetical protein SGI92_01810 [Bryobacteraceae bacterium]|nr:hypothetical protein [Bryobacteraceae bacterium]
MFTCARCESPDVIRILRRPVLDRLFGLIGAWPYACVCCGWTFLAGVCQLPAYRPAVRAEKKSVRSVRQVEGIRVLVDPVEATGGLLALWHGVTGQHTRASPNVEEEKVSK